MCNLLLTAAIWAGDEKQLVLPGAAGTGTKRCGTPGMLAIPPRHWPGALRHSLGHPEPSPGAETDAPVAKIPGPHAANRR